MTFRNPDSKSLNGKLNNSWNLDIFAEFKQNSIFWNKWRKQPFLHVDFWITELLSCWVNPRHFPKIVSFIFDIFDVPNKTKTNQNVPSVLTKNFLLRIFGILFSRFLRAKVAWGLNKSLRSEFWFELVWAALTPSQLCHSVTPLRLSVPLAAKTLTQSALLSSSHSFRRRRVVHTGRIHFVEEDNNVERGFIISLETQVWLIFYNLFMCRPAHTGSRSGL